MSDQDGAGVDHVLANRVSWDADAENWVDRGRVMWVAEDITWGIWGVPESELRLLPEVRGMDAVELGCGTGHNLAMLSEFGTVDALELDDQARAMAEKRLGRPIMRAPLPELTGVPDRHYDLIGTFDVIEHVADDAAAIASIVVAA